MFFCSKYIMNSSKTSLYHSDKNMLNYKFIKNYSNSIIHTGNKVKLTYSNKGIYCDLAKGYETIIDCDGNVSLVDIIITKQNTYGAGDVFIRDNDVVVLTCYKTGKIIGRFIIRNWTKMHTTVMDNNVITLVPYNELVRYTSEIEDCLFNKKEIISTLKMFEINLQ